ncbi:hypothetical protein HQN60_12525 [Deefgea piscis]|uniref:Uncharacterized protein n=1 Tax=Deefgea piscis TaxID=2739061 RepID=A0A6M8SQ93_9NEIS|nr:hypothetical protein [Deefgea piscis]QKJ67463.1 hypothetical protein HQN60_12525 [Deefgea piscis]
MTPEFEQRIAQKINPDSIMPEGITGHFWPVYLRGHWGTAEQGALGVILKIETPVPQLVWKIMPPLALADLYNTETLESWTFQLEILEETLSRGDTQSPFPNSLIFGEPMPCRFPDISSAVNSLYEACTSFHHGLAKQEQLGGELNNPSSAKSQMLIEISKRLARHITIINDAPHNEIIRLEGLGLFGIVTDGTPQSAINTAVELRKQQTDDEPLTVCMVNEDLVYAEAATAKLIESLLSIGVNSIIAPDDNEAIRQIEQNANK